jgi:hypothetical protein
MEKNQEPQNLQNVEKIETFNQAQKRERTEEKVRYGEGPTKI